MCVVYVSHRRGENVYAADKIMSFSLVFFHEKLS